MSTFYPLIYGSLLTLGIIMPLGAQNIFIFNQGLEQPRFIHALPSILSTTICDAILVSASIFGLTLFVFEISWLKNSILFLGGCFLLFLSFSLWNKVANPLSKTRSLSWIKQITYALSVSILNPQAMMDTFIIIGSNALLFTTTHSKLLFCIACVLTELVWFSCLGYLGRRLGRIPNNEFIINLINKFSAIIVLFIAFTMFYNFIHYIYA